MEITQLKKRQRAFYDSIGSVHCPILDTTVYFTARGFFHLVNKRGVDHRTYPRKTSEQVLKLMCLKYVPEVIKNCTTIMQPRVINGNIKGRPKQITQFALIYKVSSGEEVRVVIERIGNGKHQFISVMPHRRKKKTKKRP